MRFPVVVPLLPGLRWRGKLTIKGHHGDGYLVGFDAQASDATWIYDITVLSASKLRAYTGWSEGL